MRAKGWETFGSAKRVQRGIWHSQMSGHTATKLAHVRCYLMMPKLRSLGLIRTYGAWVGLHTMGTRDNLTNHAGTHRNSMHVRTDSYEPRNRVAG